VRQAAPRASVPNHAEQGVDDLPEVHFPGTSPPARRWQQRSQNLPFRVRQAALEARE
jgi:hypothetical protein